MSENRERRKEGGEHGHGTLQGPTRQAGRKEGRATSVNLPPLAMSAASGSACGSGSSTSKRWFTQHAEFDVHLIKSG